MTRKIRRANTAEPNSLSSHYTSAAGQTHSHMARKARATHAKYALSSAARGAKSANGDAGRGRIMRQGQHALRVTRRTRAVVGNPPALARGRASAGAGINKSAFVRSLPGSLSAAEVIEKGKAKGIKLSAAQVYTIRANARRKSPDKVSTRLLRGTGIASRAARGRSGEAKEAEFIAAALDLGLARAEALIRALRAKASAGWS
jgi:hypothetical protein